MLYKRTNKKDSKQKLRSKWMRAVCIKTMMGVVIGAGCFLACKKDWRITGTEPDAKVLEETIYVMETNTESPVINNLGTSMMTGSFSSSNMVYSSETVLVNKQHRLSENYEVSLHKLKNGQQVAEIMYEDLRNMLFTGEAEENVSFIVSSGYRDEMEQRQLLIEEIVKNQSAGMNYEEAKEDALQTVAPAGYSEHETGLAVDIVAETNQRLDDTQECTRENQWLQENCYKYGFILRYPKGKEEITGFSYESWHFRYVGKEAAREITEKGITLEEYLE